MGTVPIQARARMGSDPCLVLRHAVARRGALGLVLALLLLLPRDTQAQTAGAGHALPGWMTGCWSGERAGERFTERWTAVDADTLLAVTYTVAGGKMNMFEYLQIVRRQDRLVFIAQPWGRSPTEFVATAVGERRVMFENPANDFPKRITYALSGTAQLTATIDKGSDDGRIEFPMTRVLCDP